MQHERRAVGKSWYRGIRFSSETVRQTLKKNARLTVVKGTVVHTKRVDWMYVLRSG
ncbi:hypothetical protein PI95_004215 [Hassallia byssoidea VB512170]|uniref:Uncharacterized protein n=1 Tax=Hassallia byssoidea VB512170 TaxID=1304833 RepID=A0A846H5D6_9CYAN|nr:hypothetical protein [Hassalia byssoidea]NEU71801.1 hypothetical protein [Hassalia byssoidea VB512170]